MVIFWLVVAMLIGAFLSGVGIGITYDTTLAPILAGIIALVALLFLLRRQPLEQILW